VNAPNGSTASPVRAHRTAPLDRDLVATFALATYSLAVAVGFARVFSGWAFLSDLALIVLVGHGTSFALRRAHVDGWLAIPGMAVVLVWLVAAIQYSSTFAWIFPWRDTWVQYRLDMTVVRDQFQTAVAPVIYDVGWATLAALAMVLVVVMADAFAFRAEARAESLVPGGVLFVFIAALGSPRLRIAATVLLIAAGILTVVALRVLHDRRRRVDLASSRRPAWVLPAASATAIFVAVAAGVVGPRLPGAGADPLYETRGRGGGITEVLSPLVDIRSRLVNRGNVELFRVNADAEAYWRQTTLPEFDGSTFKLPKRSLTRIDDNIATTGGREIRQQIQILSLGGPLLPAAADPQRVAPNEDIRLNTDTSTLVKTSPLEAREVFTIISQTADVTPEVLRAATTANPPDEIFLGLPDDFPESVRALAADVTAGAATDYDRMLALQGFFRGFTYSLEVQAGHGSNAIENFLEIRTGYCEQFSATMAAMARSLGVPSRVAVGFTPGVLGDDGWYSVLGKNAHAWPEIWFDGVGWVAFEPTPSRGIPGAEDVTGVPPQQDTTPAEAPGDGVADAGTVPPPPTTVFRPPTTAAPRPDGQAPAQPTPRPATTTSGTDDGGADPWMPITVVALGVLALAAPAIVRRLRARRARHRASRERIVAAWERACRDVARAGVDARPSMTSREWADAAASQLPVAARPMASLAATLDLVEYARPESIDDAIAGSLGDECEEWAGQVGRIATDTLPVTRKAARYFSEWN
jgi:transglutaminase-like putative cysteine protease